MMTKSLKLLILMALFTGVIVYFAALPAVWAQADCTDTGTTGIPQNECEALVALYDNTDGTNWTDNTNWNTSGTACNSWYGVTVSDGNVIQVDLNSNLLSGSIPTEIGSLTSLTHLLLFNNLLSGSIPAEIGDMASLERLFLFNNQLSGSIPAGIGNLTGLERLFLFNNQLSGSIPAGIGNLTGLTYLYLYSNQLSNPIPTEIGALTNLQFLLLHYNQLSGDIPASLINCPLTVALDLGYNMLTASDAGLIAFLATHDPNWDQTQTVPPTGIGATVASNTSVDVTWTPINYTGDGGYYHVYYGTTPGGPYPNDGGTTADKTAADHTVSGLTSLTTYYFVVVTHTPVHGGQQNALTSLPSLEATATTPGADCTDTGTTGIPQNECEALVALYTDTNGPGWTNNTNWNTAGTACNDWYMVTVSGGNVTRLNLYNNQLNGPLPTEIGNLTSLEYAWLTDNQLSGPMPTQIGNLTSLIALHLHFNQLSGFVPTEISNMASLTQLYLYNNQLSGPIPTEIGDLTNLTGLGLHNNHLNGSIPVEIGNLTGLHSLYLSSNQLSGSIPTQIGDLTNLIDLDLHSNQLSGNIPTTLQNCPLTQHLHLGYNMLTASDAALLAFLAVHDANWYVTQTVPPDGVGAAAAAGASVDVSWTPINYTGHGGYYQVRYGQNPGGPYPNDGGTTADKTAAGHTVSGLAPNTAYYFVVETYTPPHGDQQSALTSDPSAEATATTPSTVTQDIPIPVGWSWISSYATPPDPVMHNIWNPHWQAGNILFAQSYADGFWFRDAAGVVTNTFSASWDMEQMYRLYSSTSFDLSFTGAMAANPIPLTTGWNWTAYLLDTTMPAQNALASIITPGFLNIVQGLAGFCIPGIYCNLDMAPGQGYQFHMNTAANLDYNAHTTVREEASPPLAEEMLVHFGYTTTSQYYPLVFSDQNNDLPFTVGDEIGLFAQNGDDLFCIGAAAWTGEQPFAMRGWADDALTDARDGYTAGEPIILKYWSAVEDQEYALTVAFEDDASSYESALYSIADLATLSIEEPEVADHGFGLEQNHPNPWFLSSSKGNSSTSIRYQVPTAGQVTLSIHNAVGQLVRTLVDADMQPGRYQTEWDGRNDGQAKVAAGIYFYSLESGGQSLTRKMILLR